jgi:hypothetical protein
MEINFDEWCREAKLKLPITSFQSVFVSLAHDRNTPAVIDNEDVSGLCKPP